MYKKVLENIDELKSVNVPSQERKREVKSFAARGSNLDRAGKISQPKLLQHYKYFLTKSVFQLKCNNAFFQFNQTLKEIHDEI